MQTRYLLIVLMLFAIVFIRPVLAASPHTGTWESKNFLDPAWSTIVSYNPFGSTGSSGAINGMFDYTLQPWEVEACQAGVTTDLESQNPQGFADSTTTLENVYGPTIALNAYSTAYIGEYLYEISWYVQPADGTITYALYLTASDGSRVYIVSNNTADPAQGDTGYYPQYYAQNFTQATIIDVNSKQILFQVPIVEKTG